MFTLQPQNQESRFRRRIKELRSEWQTARIRGVLRVTDEAKFWYWQEFGTATKGIGPGASGEEYMIPEEKLPYRLGPFRDRAGKIVAPWDVVHPGIRPARFVSKSLEEIRRETFNAIMEAFTERGWFPQVAADALEQTALPKALEIIVEQLAKDVPGTRPAEPPVPAGRLEGQTAAEVFEQAAEIEVSIE